MLDPRVWGAQILRSSIYSRLVAHPHVFPYIETFILKSLNLWDRAIKMMWAHSHSWDLGWTFESSNRVSSPSYLACLVHQLSRNGRRTIRNLSTSRLFPRCQCTDRIRDSTPHMLHFKNHLKRNMHVSTHRTCGSMTRVRHTHRELDVLSCGLVPYIPVV